MPSTSASGRARFRGYVEDGVKPDHEYGARAVMIGGSGKENATGGTGTEVKAIKGYGVSVLGIVDDSGDSVFSDCGCGEEASRLVWDDDCSITVMIVDDSLHPFSLFLSFSLSLFFTVSLFVSLSLSFSLYHIQVRKDNPSLQYCSLSVRIADIIKLDR